MTCNRRAILLFSGVSKASVWTMVLQGLTGGGVSGLIIVPAAKRAEEECDTERGHALAHRKHIVLPNCFVLFCFAFF